MAEGGDDGKTLPGIEIRDPEGLLLTYLVTWSMGLGYTGEGEFGAQPLSQGLGVTIRRTRDAGKGGKAVQRGRSQSNTFFGSGAGEEEAGEEKSKKEEVSKTMAGLFWLKRFHLKPARPVFR